MGRRVARRAVSWFVACASTYACYAAEPSREPDVPGDDSSVSDPREHGGGDADCLVGCSADSIYWPVCGVDGRTYQSEEVARNCCHVEIAHMGVCEDDDAGDADSDPDVGQPDGDGDANGDADADGADVESDGGGGIG